jgi:hypothetical protein
MGILVPPPPKQANPQQFGFHPSQKDLGATAQSEVNMLPIEAHAYENPSERARGPGLPYQQPKESITGVSPPDASSLERRRTTRGRMISARRRASLWPASPQGSRRPFCSEGSAILLDSTRWGRPSRHPSPRGWRGR